MKIKLKLLKNISLNFIEENPREFEIYRNNIQILENKHPKFGSIENDRMYFIHYKG